MELEFEAKRKPQHDSERADCYQILRKGLGVGYIWLNKEPYSKLGKIKELRIR